MEGRVFDIQHFGVHDGPGIRTLVFLKGCPMSCAWCCNPESRSPEPQLRYIHNRCTACYGCMAVCPAGAIFPDNGKVAIHFEACKTCPDKPCITACNYGAITLTGYSISSERLMEIIRKDIPFYRNSGGGVTFTGGEPLAQPEFLAAMLEQCKSEGIHTAVETCGCAKQDHFERILPLTDLFLYDLKIVDPDSHRQYTGKDNRLILDNLAWLVGQKARIIIRFPLISGITDREENTRAVLSLMETLGLDEIHLEPGHDLGVAKYAQLGMQYRLDGLPDTGYPLERLEQIRELFVSYDKSY